MRAQECVINHTEIMNICCRQKPMRPCSFLIALETTFMYFSLYKEYLFLDFILILNILFRGVSYCIYMYKYILFICVSYNTGFVIRSACNTG